MTSPGRNAGRYGSNSETECSSKRLMGCPWRGGDCMGGREFLGIGHRY